MKIGYILSSMRPRQWTKNLFIFAGIVFSRHLFEPDLLLRSFYAFVIFCAASGAAYLLNDVFDVKRDVEHPIKRNRPIASGLLSLRHASAVAISLFVFASIASYTLGTEFLLVLLAFIVLNLAYSTVLRQVVILDVIAISFNFLLRAWAGVAVLHPVLPSIEISPWLLICTLFLSLFLGFCKRRNEIENLEDAAMHRNALQEYSVHLLDQLVGLSAATALISYSIYTVWPATVEKFGTANLVFTVPFVVFGMMRYLFVVYSRKEGGDPSGVLLTEKWIIVDVFLWLAAVILILWLR